MSTEPQKELVVVITHGTAHELSSVALTIANGGITAGLKISLFLTSDAVDLVRKRAIDLIEAHPLEPLRDLMASFIQRGGTVWACTPCVKNRGYSDDQITDGVTVTGAGLMHQAILKGAGTLSF